MRGEHEGKEGQTGEEHFSLFPFSLSLSLSLHLSLTLSQAASHSFDIASNFQLKTT